MFASPRSLRLYRRPGSDTDGGDESRQDGTVEAFTRDGLKWCYMGPGELTSILIISSWLK